MDLVGKILAQRYEIHEEIGKGGMAQVYKAWCTFLNRYVAIKVLKEEFKDDREFVRRFNVEAQAAAGISNPHVVSIYDVGFENGLYYIVMEYIEGITLKEYIAEKGCLSWREAATFAAQICEGLAAAHKAKVIHRDIKPQNIIMTPDGVLKVTDFGIARASTQATTTMGGNAIGTVHYLSPEQARGGYTDQRTDIYSLGVVLYEMLTGQLPFMDESPVAVAIKHIQESPKPLREINPDIPSAMEAVTLRAMNKEQSVRYPSAEAYLSDINHVLMNPDCHIEGAALEDSFDDMGSTIKMKSIDDDDLESYSRTRRKGQTRSGDSRTRNAGHKTTRVSEESKLREVEDKRLKREEKKKERRTTWLAILTAVLVITVLGFAFSGLTGGFGFFMGGEKIIIPKVVDMDIEKAQHQYKGEFSIVKSSARQSDKIVGAILEQTPAAGDKVRKTQDMVIYVVVSAGNDAVTLENYVGMESKEAQEAIKKAGFQINVVEQESDSAEKGKVFAQEPRAGSAISQGGLIKIYVSKGSAENEPTASASAKPTAMPSSTPAPSATAKPKETQTATPTEKATEKPVQTQKPEVTAPPVGEQ